MLADSLVYVFRVGDTIDDDEGIIIPLAADNGGDE